MGYTAAAKRRGIDPAISRDRVLEAAEALIASGRFAQATVAELAEAAGVSRATVFGRFGSKVGVVEALALRFESTPEVLAIRDAFDSPDPARAARTLVSLMCDLWELQGQLVLTIKAFAELEPGSIAMLDRQRRIRRRLFRKLARDLDDEQRLRGLSVDDAVAALLLITSVESFMELRRNAGLSLGATKAVLGKSLEGLFDLRPKKL